MWERIKNTVTENLNLKLLSFVVALLLYSLVHGGQDARRSVVVDLDVLLPAESSDQVLVSAIPQSIRIFVRGSNQTIDNLRASSVTVQVDLSKNQPSHVVFAPSMVRFMEGAHVEVEEFNPPGIDLRWERRVVRDVPVQLSVAGAPADGFVVKDPLTSEPKTVKVSGVQSEVSVLQHVSVDAFDVRGLSEGSYSRTLAVKPPTTGLKVEPTGLKVDPQTVLVTADITREVAERVFQKLPVAVVGPSKGRTLPAEVDVRLVCPPDLVHSLRPEQIVPQVTVDARDPAGSKALAVSVHLDRCDAYVVPREVVAHWGP